MSIQRIFLIDSKAVETGIQQIKKHKANFIEIMPGLIPIMISKIKGEVEQSIIAGGLVSTKDQVKSAIKAGAIAVSTSKEELWNIFWKNKVIMQL